MPAGSPARYRGPARERVTFTAADLGLPLDISSGCEGRGAFVVSVCKLHLKGKKGEALEAARRRALPREALGRGVLQGCS